MPNGTDASVNETATRLGVSFSFFHLLLGTLSHAYGLPGQDRYVAYEELCELLDDDDAWREAPLGLFQRLLARRASRGRPTAGRGLLGDLEDQYSVPRDNLNTVLNKAFQQTGLFEYEKRGGRIVGIALAANLDVVLSARARFVLDHVMSWDGGSWAAHLQTRTIDLPFEVSVAPTELYEEEVPQEPLDGLVSEAAQAFNDAGLRIEEEFVRRFAAALLTKPFVILTGLSGSGKTKLAHAFAAWLCPKDAAQSDPFAVGTTLNSDRAGYRVTASDTVAIEMESSDGTRTALPRSLISEWVQSIREGSFTRTTPPRTIRDAVASTTRFSTQLNSFESQLKAAAFAQLENAAEATYARRYELVAVGADWTAKENSLGYQDSLNPGRYVRTTPVIDLLVRAKNDPRSPYFLILDEMNLSHVERYFADFLSAMESGEPILLHASGHSVDGVPPSIVLPANLFIIGTVNVDETTYTFSPKVLDRANSLEFRVSAAEVGNSLTGTRLRMSLLEAQGRKYATAFGVAAAQIDAATPDRARTVAEIGLLFESLSEYGFEFGFRTASEISRFLHFHRNLTNNDWHFDAGMDAQICQKILPKLNGSRRRLEPVLCALSVLCHRSHVWDETGAILSNRGQLLEEARRAGTLTDEMLHPVLSPAGFASTPFYPVSFEKVRRMLSRVVVNGFASFAEA